MANFKNGKYAKKPCSWCKKQTTNPKYCSNACQGAEGWENKKINFEANGVINATQNTIRKYITEKYKGKCCMCGISEWNNKPIVLQVDHINGKANDNSINNLRLICPNCDSQTEFYKNRNKNSDRIWRRITQPV